MTETTALATVDRTYQGLQMAVAPAEALRRVQELQAFVKEVMVPGEDFGVIPGTNKPTLYQPGAQKLSEIYGLAPHFEDVAVVERWDGEPFFHYRKKCILRSRRSGDVVAEGVGSCNSREDRYAYRWCFESELPASLDKRTLKRKECRGRDGRQYVQYRVLNPDICSLVNTVEKMACKRAYVAAVISATRSAGIFTQDVEDLPAEVYGTADNRRSWDEETSGDAAGTEPRPTTQKPSTARARQSASTVPEATILEWADGLAQASSLAEVERISAEISARKCELSKRTLQDLGKAKRAATARLEPLDPEPTDPENDGR